MTDSKWQVLLPKTIDPVGPESIASFCSFTGLDEYEDRDKLLEEVGRFDAIILRTLDVNRELITEAENLKIVAKHGAGLDNVDIAAASEHDVVVCNTPGANNRAVAEHTLTLLLSVRRQVCKANQHVEDGRWERHKFSSHELTGDTLGLFGFGNIGRKVAELASGFGLNIATYDPYVDEEGVPADVHKVDSKVDLFQGTEIVSVHTPLTDETENAISDEEFEQMSDDGILVNTARGGIVDEDALLDALQKNEITGAGLDVFADEPLSSENRIATLENTICSPHIGGVTVEALENMSERASKNVEKVYNGTIPESAVNTGDIA